MNTLKHSWFNQFLQPGKQNKKTVANITLVLIIASLVLLGFYLRLLREHQLLTSELMSVKRDLQELKKQVSPNETAFNEYQINNRVNTDNNQSNQSNTVESGFYINSRFGIKFKLNDGEKVVECPFKNVSHDQVVLWITNKTPLSTVDPDLGCAVGGSINTVQINNQAKDLTTISERIAELESSTYGYTLTQIPITVFGITGVRITGNRDPMISAPLPNSVDLLMFENGGFFYQIPASYLNRDISLVI